jgi:hypothetical protein
VQLGAYGPGEPAAFDWDLDGDGAYDDAAGAAVSKTLDTATTLVGVRATDTDGASQTLRQTFTVGTLPPQASFAISGGTATSTSSDPELTVTVRAVDPAGNKSSKTTRLTVRR